jgi:ubiquinone/menaquinone biosynthesis C-methylase UbiE
MLKSHYRDVAENQDKHWWYLGMTVINNSLIKTFLYKRNNLKILDAGCGPGAMLPTLAKYGDVVGIDISEEALKYAGKRGKVIKGDITKLDFEDNTFDLVICMDVLYHMWVKDEIDALKEFNRVLKNGGILLLREPAYNWLRGNEDVGSLTKRRFQKRDLEDKITQSSFKMLKISYVNFFLFPILLIVRILTGLSGKRGESDMSIPPGIINRFLFKILRTEASLLKFISLPFGSSIICVAEKV